MSGTNADEVSQPGVEREYRGVPEFENKPEELNRQLMLLCPEMFNEAKNQPIVSSKIIACNNW